MSLQACSIVLEKGGGQTNKTIIIIYFIICKFKRKVCWNIRPSLFKDYLPQFESTKCFFFSKTSRFFGHCYCLHKLSFPLSQQISASSLRLKMIAHSKISPVLTSASFSSGLFSLESSSVSFKIYNTKYFYIVWPMLKLNIHWLNIRQVYRY